MGVRRANHHVRRRNAAAFLDRFTRRQDGFAANHQGINPDERDAFRAVIEDRRPHLARIVYAARISFAIIPRHLHADVRRDVALRKTGLKDGAHRRHFLGLGVGRREKRNGEREDEPD